MSLGLLSTVFGTFDSEIPPLPGPSASMTRVTGGLILHDDFNRSDEPVSASDDWISTDGISIDQIENNSVVAGSPYGDIQTDSDTIAIPATCMFQINFEDLPQKFGEYVLRTFKTPLQNKNAVGINWDHGLGRYNLFIEKNGIKIMQDNVLLFDPGGDNFEQSVRVVVEEFDDPKELKARFYRKKLDSLDNITTVLDSIGIELSASMGSVPGNSGRLRVTGFAGGVYDEVRIVGGISIVVENVPTGYKARILGPALTGSLVEEIGGTITIPVEELVFPQDGIEVTDASNQLGIGSGFYTGSDVWPGDVYNFSGSIA